MSGEDRPSEATHTRYAGGVDHDRVLEHRVVADEDRSSEATDRTPLKDAREPYATMTREELLDEIDRFAQNYNALEEARDKLRRVVAEARKFIDACARNNDTTMRRELRDALDALENDQ